MTVFAKITDQGRETCLGLFKERPEDCKSVHGLHGSSSAVCGTP